MYFDSTFWFSLVLLQICFWFYHTTLCIEDEITVLQLAGFADVFRYRHRCNYAPYDVECIIKHGLHFSIIKYYSSALYPTAAMWWNLFIPLAVKCHVVEFQVHSLTGPGEGRKLKFNRMFVFTFCLCQDVIECQTFVKAWLTTLHLNVRHCVRTRHFWTRDI